MQSLADTWINFMSKKEGEWFDQSFRQNLKGTLYYYEVMHKGSGVWLVTVMMSEEVGKAVVSTTLSDEHTALHDQVGRKSIVFNRCRDERLYYHPLSKSYSENGRLRFKRIESEDDVPEEIKKTFMIDKYENVSPKNVTPSFQGKLVVTVPKDKPEQMALLYVLEKILPAFGGDEESSAPAGGAE